MNTNPQGPYINGKGGPLVQACPIGSVPRLFADSEYHCMPGSIDLPSGAFTFDVTKAVVEAVIDGGILVQPTE